MKSFRFGPEPLLQVAEFRRAFWASMAVHAALALFVTFAPNPSLAPARRAPVFVELLASLPESAASDPSDEAIVKAEPKQVVDEGVVIPKTPKPEPKPEPKAEPKPEPDPEPEAKPEPEPKPVAEPKPKPDDKPKLTKEQILAQLRERVGSVAPAASASSSSTRGGPGRVDPILAAWHAQVKDLMYSHWSGAKPFRHRTGLEVQFMLNLDSAGRVSNYRLTRTSGIRALDESAERTIRKVLPDLPPAPGGSRIVNVIFDPRDA